MAAKTKWRLAKPSDKDGVYRARDYTTHTENTAEYGFGDYHEREYFVSEAREAATYRKAQNIFKKEGFCFGGRFGATLEIYED